MWMGLQSLEYLSLLGNNIKEVPPHIISHMPALKTLGFAFNELKTISADIFNPEDYPDSNDRPEHLKLDIYGNPLQCDRALCWLKQGEESGTIDLLLPPSCENLGYPLWKNVNLNCTGNYSFANIFMNTLVFFFYFVLD